jgi:hypothetical protein
LPGFCDMHTNAIRFNEPMGNRCHLFHLSHRKISMEAALLLLVSSLKQEDKRNLLLPPPLSSQ